MIAPHNRLSRWKNVLAWGAVCLAFLAIFAFSHRQGLFSTPDRPVMASFWNFPANYDDLSPEQFVDLFDTLVFKTEAGDNRNVLYRWEKSPIKYHLIGEVDRSVRERFRRVFRELAALGSFEFHEISKIEKADIVIVFDDTGFQIEDIISYFDLNSRAVESIMYFHNRGYCWFMISYKDSFFIPRFEIDRALVFINSERPILQISHCIYHEISQSLGILNDVIGMHSVFSEEFVVSPLTEIDRSIIRALYSEELYAGMTRPAALTAVRDWFIADRQKHSGGIPVSR